MLFVKNENLKVGMRLAKPVYNKKGVLLYDRDSKLTDQGIDSVKNFGLIGLYILEPAEPVPPMSEEDLEFERFQTVAAFQIQDELLSIKSTQKAPKIQMLCADLIKRYGRLSSKINFVQNLRSNDDHVFKHSLNCAILTAMMTHVLNVPLNEQTETVMASIVHDVGKLNIPKEISDKGSDIDDADKARIDECERKGMDIIEDTFQSMPGIKRISQQCYMLMRDLKTGKQEPSQPKTVYGARILAVAECFDNMTAMNDYREPSSEIQALRYLKEHPEYFEPDVVDALVASINFLTNGCCVELSTGEKGLVISANDDNVLEPMVLIFSTNTIVDLARDGKKLGIMVKDVMKTMDNRCVVDKSALM